MAGCLVGAVLVLDSDSIRALCEPLILSKVFVPVSILWLGLTAWFCFRRWEFSPMVCVLGGLATALNSDFFSVACWGVAQQTIAFGFDFLALAALADTPGPKRWVRAILAGFAVGVNVVEAYDIGAIFSLFIGAYVVFQAWNTDGAVPRKLADGFSRLALVSISAVLLAAGTLIGLVGTQISGVAGMKQDAASKASRWDEATIWSLPKAETLGILVPGLFGFRLDTPKNMAAFGDYFEGGAYWGSVGSMPAWDRYFEAKKAGKEAQRPQAQARFTGGGCYAGVLVIVVAVWGVVQSFRRERQVFSLVERRWVWFWLGVMVISLLLAYGRFAPFYQFFYALPYASTIRNPAKFIHVFSWALTILFAFGLEAQCRTSAGAAMASRSFWRQCRAGWAEAAPIDRNWVKGTALAVVASLVAWWVYGASRSRLVAYLQEVGFDAGTGNVLAEFTQRQMGWFVLLLALSIGLFTLVLLGCSGGGRSRTGGVAIGLLLAGDLMTANLPWIIIYDWKQTYATNPVIDLLRVKPYEHRVSFFAVGYFAGLVQKLPREVVQPYTTMHALYGGEWLQHLFQYYNIQSLDKVMNPRPPITQMEFEKKLLPVPLRRWELTNTRYLLGPAISTDLINQEVDPARRSFKLVARFSLAAKANVTNPVDYPDERVTAVPDPAGQFAVYEFGAALPRAKLYTKWEVCTNDDAALDRLASPAFDPAQTVLVADAVEAPPASKAEGSNTVEITSYATKRISLHSIASSPSVLLLNDGFNPGWEVAIDGGPASLLRCNYLMRGVRVPPGSHEIEFKFRPPYKVIYISLSAIVLALAFVAYLIFSTADQPTTPQASHKAAGLDLRIAGGRRQK